MASQNIQDELVKIQRELRWLADVVDDLSVEEIRAAIENVERRLTWIRSSFE